MLRKLSTNRFLKKLNCRPKPQHLEPGLRSLVDKNGNILEKYVPVLKQMQALIMAKNLPLINDTILSINTGSIDDAVDKWTEISRCFAKNNIQSFHELYKKYPKSEWKQANSLIDTIASLDAAQSAQFRTRKGHLDIYTAPEILDRKLKISPQEALDYIRELALLAKTAPQFMSVNFAANRYLRHQGVAFKQFEDLFNALPVNFRLKLHKHNASQLHIQNNQVQLIGLLDLFNTRNVSLSSPHMSTFLRAVFSGSDSGASKILDSLKTREFSIGFYHFLVRKLCNRQDKDTVDWLFSNRLMPLMEANPNMVQFVLYSLLVRTLAFDGFDDAKPVLSAMGDSVHESSWRAIFHQFRKIGEVEKAFDTLRKAVVIFNFKLSFVMINEYLLLVAQNYRPQVFFLALDKVFPEFTPTLNELGLIDVHSMGPEPDFCLQTKHRNFKVGQVHESTLAIAYNVVLNNTFDISEIMHLYCRYEQLVTNQTSRATMSIVDEFVTKLTSMATKESVDCAERIYIGALGKLPLKKPLDGRFGNRSLHTLMSHLSGAGEIQRALKLADLTGNHPDLALRGKSLRRLYYSVREHSIRNGETFAQWAQEHGAIVSK